ncbi:uncharacterized protein LOC105177941 [Sesamum indicum]|uniref:Uncharacterized protein LOC105177941 n=1 Tax=Sesamum indicum TaxID=4182 RepID=A0A6I9UKG4_SESIN|nr:uncharacterized protein LOC105177941 [Sesamum indicum]
MDCCENPMAMGRVICPKPRRPGQSNINSPAMVPLRFHIRNDAESKPAAELLGLILCKEDFKAERCATPSSSPPFLFGSPPCRTANPLVQDAHFGVERLTNMHRTPTDLALPRSPHAREQFGKKQATVRVVGFHC